MKKLIALISAIAVMGTMSLTSFAAITVTPNADIAEDVTLAQGATSGYDAAYKSDAVNTQTTIVAVKGTEITTSSIQYINQLEQDSEAVINFDLKDTLAAGETVTVYMGGDKIAKTTLGTIASVADAPAKYTVTFYDEDGTTQLQTAEYESGAALTAPANPTKAADANYTYAFAGWALKSAPTAVISLPANVTEAAEYVAVYTATPIQSGGNEFTLTFLNADGTTFATTTTVSGAVQLPTTEPTKTKTGATGDKLDWAFVGWYTDADLTTALGATVSANTTVYPKFVNVPICGDVNASASVTAADITNMKKYMLMTDDEKAASPINKEFPNTWISKKSANQKCGDVNESASITAADITNMKKYMLMTDDEKAASPINKPLEIFSDAEMTQK